MCQSKLSPILYLIEVEPVDAAAAAYRCTAAAARNGRFFPEKILCKKYESLPRGSSVHLARIGKLPAMIHLECSHAGIHHSTRGRVFFGFVKVRAVNKKLDWRVIEL